MRSLPQEDFGVCRAAFGARRHRLPCRARHASAGRGAGLLLLGDARTDPRTGRYAGDAAHDRGVPLRQARRSPCPALWRPASRHSARAHAQRAPALGRLDARAPATRRPQHRARHGGTDHHGHVPAAVQRQSGWLAPIQIVALPAAASRVGLSHLPWHPAAVPRHGGQPGRGSQQSGGRDRRTVLRGPALPHTGFIRRRATASNKVDLHH
jgi:hypothetical protein